MGFFSKKSEPTGKISIKVFNFDIKSLIDGCIEFNREIKDDKTAYIDYLDILPAPLFELFDFVKFRIFSEEKKIDDATQCHLTLSSREPNINDIDSIRRFVNYVDDLVKGKDPFTDTDVIFLNKGLWRGRMYNINKKGKYERNLDKWATSIDIQEDDNKIELSIMLINKLELN